MKLRLYVSGTSELSRRAVEQAQAVCELIADAEIEIVDLSSSPEVAEQDNVLSTPTLRRLDVSPERRVVGDMSDAENVAAYLSRT